MVPHGTVHLDPAGKDTALSENHPADDEPIEAEIVEESDAPPEAETPAALDADVVEELPAPSYVPPPKSSPVPLVLFIGGLALVFICAVLLRVELTGFYDDIVAKLFGTTKKTRTGDVADASSSKTPESADNTDDGDASKTVRDPDRLPSTGKDEPVVIPEFEKRELPELPGDPVPEIPTAERTPGYGYSRLERLDLSRNGVTKHQIKVMVPAHYKEADLRRVAEAVIGRQRKLGECHAIRVLFFTDTEKTARTDAVAEAVWAPEGKFVKAPDAVRAGSDKNTLHVRMLGGKTSSRNGGGSSTSRSHRRGLTMLPATAAVPEYRVLAERNLGNPVLVRLGFQIEVSEGLSKKSVTAICHDVMRNRKPRAHNAISFHFFAKGFLLRFQRGYCSMFIMKFELQSREITLLFPCFGLCNFFIFLFERGRDHIYLFLYTAYLSRVFRKLYSEFCFLHLEFEYLRLQLLGKSPRSSRLIGSFDVFMNLIYCTFQR